MRPVQLQLRESKRYKIYVTQFSFLRNSTVNLTVLNGTPGILVVIVLRKLWATKWRNNWRWQNKSSYRDI